MLPCMRLPKMLLLAITAIATTGFSSASLARFSGPQLFCDTYPSSELCGQATDCSICHSTAPDLNPYGLDLQNTLFGLTPPYVRTEFELRLNEALTAVEDLDSDGDSENNILEILQGTQPGNPNSNRLDNNDDVTWNASIAYKKIGALFCGRSPSYQQMQTLEQATDKNSVVHEYLDSCLQTDFWKTKALHRLADKRIRPIEELGLNGSISLSDYMWDYRLFSYALSDDRDARDLILADYHVDENYNVIRGIIPKQRPFSINNEISLGTGQPLVENRRAGMITTQWFLSMFTMFSELPRNTASQAYRAYLGLDIAKGEGLFPVAAEPSDVDNKSVDQPACAVCHSTLDPLAYSFATYNGIALDNAVELFTGNPLGSYNANREPWEADGYIFGQPVANLNAWAQIAANSDAFKINLTRLFFEYAVGRAPASQEQSEFEAIWQATPQDNYSANRLIHRIVDTKAFGGQQ